MNELGQLYINMLQFQKATAVLSEAHYISPERTFITESLALAHIYRQQFDTANALAESLFRVDPNSPGAHLIMLTVALNRGHQGEARVHYESFLALGEGRSDYENIRQYYHYLVQ